MKKPVKRKTKSRVNEAGNYTKPTMRKQLFNKIKAGGKGGKLRSRAKRKTRNHNSSTKDTVDAMAAAFILQGFLDSLRDKEQCQSI